MTVRVALIQLDCSISEPPAHRVTRALALVDRTAVESDADLVILPELWHVGAFNTDGAREHAQSINGPLVTALGALASQHGIWLHGGSFCEIDDDGQHYNTSVLFAPDGVLVASYRKVHLFDVSIPGKVEVRESARRGHGADVVCVDAGAARLGLSVCYDLRFPELYRALARYSSGKRRS